ncbi:CPBP family intramembrane glutamic endopeptidase [uncultured Sphingomonas sp.]|uniref:CPBP family intramembrane glutamic endopeptidase n=1 Tax=uncultured Sphingomonas sp. TaxID=158754 RepID=UPI0035CABFEF
MLPLVLLLVTIGLLGWFARRDIAEYLYFTGLIDSVDRRHRYAGWIAKQLLFFALPALVGLALLGRLRALTVVPVEFVGAAALLPAFGASGDDGWLLAVLIGAVGGGSIAALAIWLVGRWRGGVRGPTFQIADTGSLMPRNRAELGLGALLSVSAGVTEELMFRLFLPLLLGLVTGSIAVAFIVPIALFGAMHRYQGWVGIAATTIVGSVMTGLYLASGSLATVMILHVVIDLNGLVLRPALNGAWRVAPSD